MRSREGSSLISLTWFAFLFNAATEVHANERARSLRCVIFMSVKRIESSRENDQVGEKNELPLREGRIITLDMIALVN